jgi:acyl-CoA dehydrogenase
MKLYAYRALDYVQSAHADDRRYLLYCAVQKAKVSTEGVKVMALLSECVGAKGFEAADTYFEMALRDAQLVPLLESSAHINLGLTGGFTAQYFGRPDLALGEVKSLAAEETASMENPYLMEARSSAISTIAFPPYQQAYKPLANVLNVRLFRGQAKALRLFLRTQSSKHNLAAQNPLALSQCVATIAYGQLIAENAVRLAVPNEMVSGIFQLLVADLSAAALALASTPDLDPVSRMLIQKMVVASRTRSRDWDFVSNLVASSR